MADAREECGLAAVALKGSDLKKYPNGGAAFYLMKMLLQQQNRGQLSAGISTYFPDRSQILATHKENGLVGEVFRLNHSKKNHSVLKYFSGLRGIGHVRYATSGANQRGYAHPFERVHGRVWKWFSFAVNGNLANFADLKRQLREEKYHLTRNTDTEIIMHFISKQFLGPENKDHVQVFKNLSEVFDGSYNIVYLNAAGDLVVLRDPLGFKPLCFGSNDKLFAAASESVAPINIGVEEIHPVKPGEMIIVNKKGYSVERFAKSPRRAHCMFEYVYFANVASVIDGRSVYRSRWDMGAELAKREFVKADDDTIVIGVPETSKPMADALGHELGLPTKEGLIRNRYLGRIFIEHENRDQKVRDKFNVIRRILKGKKVIVTDDSIVRGTTSQALVKYLRDAGGAKEVHLRTTCPPIKYPCFYGIDFSTSSELIAARACKDSLGEFGWKDITDEQNETIRKEIGADSLMYQKLGGLVKSINLPKEDLCMACLTGEYPTPCGQKLAQKAIEDIDSDNNSKRTYE